MNFRKILSETYAVLLKLGDEFTSNIPKNVFDDIDMGRDVNYNPVIDENKALHEQGLAEETIALIFSLKRDYVCETQEEKDEINRIMEENEGKFNEQLKGAKSTMQLLKMLKENK